MPVQMRFGAISITVAGKVLKDRLPKTDDSEPYDTAVINLKEFLFEREKFDLNYYQKRIIIK